MTHYRTFDGNDACPFTDCKLHECCSGAWHHDGNVKVPDISTERPEGFNGASHTGEAGANAFVICYSWEKK